MNRKSAMLCIRKYLKGGVENALLTKHINKFAESAGHARLSTISQSKVRTILEEADIKPNKILGRIKGTKPSAGIMNPSTLERSRCLRE